jgi:Asp-tRNA(Asn)/Glu-tRNA(Gln) amidotransferase C subunit
MSFEMYTPAGDRACQTQLNKIVKFIEKGKDVSPTTIENMYDTALSKIETKHPEVHDTEPAWHMRNGIKKALEINFFDKTKFF